MGRIIIMRNMHEADTRGKSILIMIRSEFSTQDSFFFINIQKLQGFFMYFFGGKISNLQNSVKYPVYSYLLLLKCTTAVVI